MGEPYTWKPEDPEAVRKREEAAATIIVRAQLRKEATLVKVYADMVYQMVDIVNASYGPAPYTGPGSTSAIPDTQGKRQIFAYAPDEFVSTVRELESAVTRLKTRSGVYR